MQKFAELREVAEYVRDHYNSLISHSSWFAVLRLLNEVEAEMKDSLKTAARMGVAAGVLLTGTVLGAVSLMWKGWSPYTLTASAIWLMGIGTAGLIAGSLLVLLRTVPNTIVYVLTKSDGGRETGDGR